jgi:hypothetical protein
MNNREMVAKSFFVLNFLLLELLQLGGGGDDKRYN